MILALASSYRRCFSSSSFCWRILISSGVGWCLLAFGSSSSSSSSVNRSKPVTGSRLVMVFGVGLRLSSFMAGLKPVARGTLLVAATKMGSSGGFSLVWG
jgi:hypothetical protein